MVVLQPVHVPIRLLPLPPIPIRMVILAAADPAAEAIPAVEAIPAAVAQAEAARSAAVVLAAAVVAAPVPVVGAASAADAVDEIIIVL